MGWAKVWQAGGGRVMRAPWPSAMSAIVGQPWISLATEDREDAPPWFTKQLGVHVSGLTPQPARRPMPTLPVLQVCLGWGRPPCAMHAPAGLAGQGAGEAA